MYGLIQQIISFYPPGPIKNRLAAAAMKFRIPYWDWAAVPPSGQSVLPTSVRARTVAVEGPNGHQEIRNPLFSYLFRPLDTTALSDFPVSDSRLKT